MRAVGLHSFGGPEVLEVVELPAPEPGRGEVRVRVVAATVNPTDLGLRAGARPALLEEIPPPSVPGMELAGEIDAGGAGSEWSVGERVIAMVTPWRALGGAQAERVVVPARSLAPAPGARAGAGELTLRVAESYPPERSGEAHRRLEAGGVRGRLLIAF